MTEQADEFHQWAIVELMGHVMIAGLVTEEERFGVKMGRCDIPGPDGTVFATQYFSGASVYRVTPTTEENATKIALARQPRTPALMETTKLIYACDDDDYEFAS